MYVTRCDTSDYAFPGMSRREVLRTDELLQDIFKESRIVDKAEMEDVIAALDAVGISCVPSIHLQFQSVRSMFSVTD